MAAANPIAERLDRLVRQWDAFGREREARLLRWVFAPDEWRMFEALLALEQHAEGELPVLFIVLATPFEAAARHGHELRRTLAEQAADAASTEAFARLGVPAWRSPMLEANSSDIGMFSESLASLQRHLASHLELVAIVLWPSAVADASAYAGWLQRLAAVVPAHVKVVVPDRSDAPQLAALADHPAARTVVADLDMPGAVEELARTSPGASEPGGRFRAAFVAMSAALGRGQLDEAREHAAVARAIAESTPGFAHLEVSLAFGLASGLLGRGEHAGAIAEYLRAEQLAAAAAARGAEWAPLLRLRAAIALGSALVAAQAWSDAAQRFFDAATLAKSLGESGSELDCLRMAAWSYERDGRAADAWAIGDAALVRAAELDEATRSASTLPWLGEMMLRLSERGPHADDRGRLVRRLAELLGTQWRSALARA